MGDAFDLFTYYEHRGDRNAAIRAAGEMFGLNRQQEQQDSWQHKSMKPPNQKNQKPLKSHSVLMHSL